MLAQEGDSTFQLENESTGPLMPFNLNDEKITHLGERCGFRDGAAILQKHESDWTSLESVVIQASQALGRSVVASSVDESFLGCTIAVERLLIQDGIDTTVERFSDRLALLLGGSKEVRESISKTAKRLYDLRSKIVHKAFAGITDDDYRIMENWAISCLIEALQTRQSEESHAEFCRTINARKFV